MPFGELGGFVLLTLCRTLPARFSDPDRSVPRLWWPAKGEFLTAPPDPSCEKSFSSQLFASNELRRPFYWPVGCREATHVLNMS